MHVTSPRSHLPFARSRDNCPRTSTHPSAHPTHWAAFTFNLPVPSLELPKLLQPGTPSPSPPGPAGAHAPQPAGRRGAQGGCPGWPGQRTVTGARCWGQSRHSKTPESCAGGARDGRRPQIRPALLHRLVAVPLPFPALPAAGPPPHTHTTHTPHTHTPHTLTHPTPTP